MEKILTVSVAGYNVAKTIRQALDSLMNENIIDKLDIIVNDDGGKDNTVEIVEEYRAKYPDSIRIIHKENGGYGSVINTNLQLAKGKYFKQLDGDDWFETGELEGFVHLLEEINDDCVLTQVRVFREDTNETKISRDSKYLETTEGSHRFDETTFRDFLSMHSATFRTEAIQDKGIHITEHCFYTDTEYVNSTLPFIDTFYVYPHVIYVYRKGVEGQSISWSGRLKHYKEHETVLWKHVEIFNKIEEPHKKKLLRNRLINMGRAHLGYFYRFPVSLKNYKEYKAFGKKLHQRIPEIENSIARCSVLWKIVIRSGYRLYLLPRIPMYLRDKGVLFTQRIDIADD